MRGKLYYFIDVTFVYIVTIVLVSSIEHNIGHADRINPRSNYDDSVKNDSFYGKDCSEKEVCLDLTEYVGDYFPLVAKYFLANELDPLTIPDIRQSFWMPSLFLPTEFSELTYSFSSGSLYYLSELERAGRVIGIYGDKTLGIYASITFDSILLSYDYFVKLLFLSEYGRIHAKATFVRVEIRIDFDIVGFKSIKLSIHGSDLAKRFMTPFVKAWIFLTKKSTIKTIEEIATTMFREHLEKTNENISLYNLLMSLVTMYSM
ncbi:uncharacterized protein LOC143154716 isoform X2 [Ptiloglossa arizonensis]|uniref:uncharacterized protein LOC143154716 isoform X2 n=1 Tax=Ptiloglossa arizonensis TaxID=3350558 RepID=UPI003F9F6464